MILFSTYAANSEIGIRICSIESLSRSVTVSSSNLIVPTHESTTINGTFNQVSSLIDAVKHVPLNGGESYKTAYEKGHGEGGYTTEGAPATEADVEFGYAEITKSKIDFSKCL